MKPVKPVSSYEGDRYPSTKEAGFTRRGFVRVVLGGLGAAAVGAAVGATAWDDEAEARRVPRPPGVARRPKLQTVIDLKPDYKLRGCKSAVAGINARTYDHRLIAFLRDKKEHGGLQKVVLRVLKKHTCKDVQDSSRNYKLRRKVATAIIQRYGKRTKRKAGYLWLYLQVVPTGTS